jgi:hypothetical protein
VEKERDGEDEFILAKVTDNASELASFSNEIALDGMDISNYSNGSLVRNGSETRALVTGGESAKKTAGDDRLD